MLKESADDYVDDARCSSVGSDSSEEVSDWEEVQQTSSKCYQLPNIQYNSVPELTLESLGYVSTEQWPKLVQEQKAKNPPLYDLMIKLLERRHKPNTAITIGHSTLKVHLTVLQCYSTLFCELNNAISVELPVEWVTPRAFQLVYDWMLADVPRLARLGLLEVLNAAKFLQIPQLIRQCEHCLTEGFAEDAALLLYLESRLLSLESVYRPLLQSVGRFFMTLVASQEFLQLPMQAICQLMQSNNIGVNTELEVFAAAVRWLNFQWPKRQHIVGQLMTCVRFGLVPPWLLIRLYDRETSSVELKRITSQPNVLQQMHDGIGYTTTRLCYGSDSEGFIKHMERIHMETPVPRKWIYDPGCSYHHRLHCQISKEFTYEAFVGYLNLLQTLHKDYWQQAVQSVGDSDVCCSCQRAAK